MTELPSSHRIEVSPLARVFDDVTNSYKFFWFLSILESIQNTRDRVIPISDLLANMVAYTWFPFQYFRLSFGKQDRLSRIVTELQRACGIPVNASHEDVARHAKQQIDDRTSLGKQIIALGDYVPKRFLRPFFQHQLRGLPDQRVNAAIRALASGASIGAASNVLYLFIEHQGEECIEITCPWYDYIIEHISILRDFTLWHLIRYLHKHNPNVPNIANKIFAPARRDMRRPREFWTRVLTARREQISCIYSETKITLENYTLDHFLPWRFVAHDLLWNIVPATKEANSKKSDAIPDLDKYFEGFSRVQVTAFTTALERNFSAGLLEDYIIVLKVPSLGLLRHLSYDDFKRALYDAIAPQVHIARGMGFSTGWRYISEPVIMRGSDLSG